MKNRKSWGFALVGTQLALACSAPTPAEVAAADAGAAADVGAADAAGVATADAGAAANNAGLAAAAERNAVAPDDLETFTAADGKEPFALRVSLYPWIPEPESFVAWIEANFEAQNPDIDLVVRPLVKSYDWEAGYVADLAYETDKTVGALTDEASDDFQHLVEVDTVTLGSLGESGAIVPFHANGKGFLPAAKQATTWAGQSFGVPHWTCGYFIISEDPAVRGARDVGQLLSVLEGAGTERVSLAGDLEGSWDSITLYLDALRDTSPHADLEGALLEPLLDPAVADRLRSLRPACIKDGVNHCGDDASELFATGGADALFGFSERLNPVLSHPARAVGELHVASATLGDGDEPTAFVDALVLSAKCTSARCRQAARRFANYYVSDAVFEVALMALDTPSAVPRYLLPSTKSAFEYGRVGRDRLYAQLKHEVRRAKAFPNRGVPEARAAGVIRQQVREALGL